MNKMRLMFAVAILVTMQASALFAGSLTEVNLVSNIPGLASITDLNLENPWGVSFSSASPIWVSNQGTNTSDLFTVHGLTVTQNSLEVTIPTTTSGGPQGPTGQVNNNTSSFTVNGSPAAFIFANLNGTISAWNPSLGTAAQTQITTAGAVYTGLAISNTPQPLLYAANDSENRIDVFNGSFTLVNLGANAFSNPFSAQGWVPFNVQNIGGEIYVTYAPSGRPAQTGAMAGQGGVAVFDTSGNLLQTIITGSALAAPWGIALAPAGFAGFAGDLLVGNFSYVDGAINAFNPVTGAFIGQVISNPSFEGLWALTFGNGGNGGDPNILYFTTGLNGETNGLLAAITTPEPSSFVLLLICGLTALAFRRRLAYLRESKLLKLPQ